MSRRRKRKNSDWRDRLPLSQFGFGVLYRPRIEAYLRKRWPELLPLSPEMHHLIHSVLLPIGLFPQTVCFAVLLPWRLQRKGYVTEEQIQQDRQCTQHRSNLLAWAFANHPEFTADFLCWLQTCRETRYSKDVRAFLAMHPAILVGSKVVSVNDATPEQLDNAYVHWAGIPRGDQESYNSRRARIRKWRSLMQPLQRLELEPVPSVIESDGKIRFERVIYKKRGKWQREYTPPVKRTS